MLSESQIRRLLDIANAACHKGNVVDARAMYDGVLALRPGFVPARIGMALSHIVVNEFEEAEARLRDVLAENPDDADALGMLGLCLVLAGRREEDEAVLTPLAGGEGPTAALASGLLENLRA